MKSKNKQTNKGIMFGVIQWKLKLHYVAWSAIIASKDCKPTLCTVYVSTFAISKQNEMESKSKGVTKIHENCTKQQQKLERYRDEMKLKIERHTQKHIQMVEQNRK